MAWNRQVRVIVVPPEGDGLEFRELFMECRVVRTFKLSENTAEVIIYNANEDTRNNILVEGANVEIYAGYEDSGGPGLIFKGNVTKASPEKMLTGWAVSLTVSTIRGSELVSTVVSLSYAEDSQLVDVIRELATALDLVLYGEQNAQGIELPNGFVEVGPARQALAHVETILKDNGKGVYRDNDELVIFNQGEASYFDIVNLTYTTGLLKIAEYEETKTEKKAKTGSDARDKTQQVTIEALLFPQIRPNGLVQVGGVSSKFDGQYIPTAVEYVFDNEAGPFNIILRADKVA